MREPDEARTRSPVKLLVLGANGGCGSWVVRLAGEKGYEVTAVVRDTSPMQPTPGVRVERGEALDSNFVERVLPGHPVVISCVGQRRSGLSPWARLLSPPDLVQRVMRNVATAGEKNDVERVIWISAGGVGDSRARLTGPVRLMIGVSSVAVAYQDLEAAERVVRRSSLPSLAVRPVTLRHGEPLGRAGKVDRYGLLSTVRRGDVAKWMVAVADGTVLYEEQSVLLGERDDRGAPAP